MPHTHMDTLHPHTHTIAIACILPAAKDTCLPAGLFTSLNLRLTFA